MEDAAMRASLMHGRWLGIGVNGVGIVECGGRDEGTSPLS